MYKYILLTGCFDIIHIGHISIISSIKEKFPDHKLIIAIDSNERVKSKKGENRPINDLIDRMFVIDSIKGVFMTLPFDSDEMLISICKQYKPIRVLGDDYKGKDIIGKEHCSSIVYFNRLKNYSSTNIIEKINEKNIINS